MQLYTINATCERVDDNIFKRFIKRLGYAKTVSEVLAIYEIDGFTIQKVQGYWQGKPEISYVITVAHEYEPAIIDNVANMLRARYNQDAVMVTYPDNTVKFIERG